MDYKLSRDQTQLIRTLDENDGMPEAQLASSALLTVGQIRTAIEPLINEDLVVVQGGEMDLTTMGRLIAESLRKPSESRASSAAQQRLPSVVIEDLLREGANSVAPEELDKAIDIELAKLEGSE